jgi:hypothetical protein
MRVWDAVQVLLTFDDPPADVDVTCYIRAGDILRQRQIGGPTRAGQCSITLKNDERLFDPPWPGATPGTFGWIRPGQRVQVFYDSVQVFDGHVDDWDYDWPVNDLPTATLEASDALARLRQRKFTEWQTTSGQRIGPRMTAALARPEVDWTGSTNFDDGAMNLVGDLVPAGTDVVSYFQQLERTDGGRFFASRTNELRYRQVNLASTPSSVMTFTDDQPGCGINRFMVGYGSEEWYTQVNAKRTWNVATLTGDPPVAGSTTLNGVTQTASSGSAIADLHGGGYRPLDLNNLLMKIDAGAMNLAEYNLSLFQDVTPVISELRCILDEMVDADALDVVALEYGDRIDVEWTPTGSGQAVDQTLAVEGFHDVFSQTTWRRTISTSRLIGLPSWIIGTSQIGTGVLGL